MTRVTVHEYAASVGPRYKGAGRVEKGRILDEFCKATGMHRKAAIRLLGGLRPLKAGRRPRERRYGPEVGEALKRLWEVGDRMCGKLLVGVIPDLLGALERHGEMRVEPELRQALLVSAATVDRLLRPWRTRSRRQPLGASPAATTLKSQVPIRTWSEWRGVRPGSLQADLVLHCGESTEGFYLTTLTAVDVATGWTELQAVWGLGQGRVGGALYLARKQLPFPLCELHTDNGSEFINHLLVPWCRRQKIFFSRGRAYKKNDQAYVEQKNWLSVRRHVGYDRFNSKAACATLQPLHSLLRLRVNFFRPVRKIVAKERHGARTAKRYDQPLTPYQRLLASGVIDAETQQDLAEQFIALNPAELQRRLDSILRRLWSLAAHREQEARKLGQHSS